MKMFSQCLFVCLCVFASSYSHATGNLVPFIEPCFWNDEACLIASTKKAMPFFAEGLPQFGLEPMDPLKLKKVNLVVGDLKVTLTDLDVTGNSKCNILKVTRDIEKGTLRLVADCPVEVSGHYDSSGTLLFVPVEGNGPFQVKCQLIHLEVLVKINTEVGPDGVGYWKIDKSTRSFDAKEKCTFNFENLFNGDKEKAEPVSKLFDQNWRELMQTLGKPIMDKVFNKIVSRMQTFASKVPANQLEKQ